MESSEEQNVFTLWFFWQFYEMPNFLLGVWKNYLIFATNLFSLPLLLKTFISPWRKYNWKYPKGFDIGEFLNTFISNTVSRILGAIVRFVLIITGIIFQIFIIAGGLIVFVGWIAVPLIAIIGILFALMF